MDAWFYRAKMALSPQHSQSILQLGWWALLRLSVHGIPQPKTTELFVSFQTAHFIKNKCFLLFSDFLICALCGFAHSFLVNSFRRRLSVPSSVSGRDRVHSCSTSWHMSQTQKVRWRSHPPMLLRIAVLLSKCGTRLFRKSAINHLGYCWQTSKRVRLAAHFLSITNTRVQRNTKEQELSVKCLYFLTFIERHRRWKHGENNKCHLK